MFAEVKPDVKELARAAPSWCTSPSTSRKVQVKIRERGFRRQRAVSDRKLAQQDEGERPRLVHLPS